MIFDYEEFYNHAPVGYFTSDENSIIINANSFFLSLVQYEEEEVIHRKGLQDFLGVGGKIFFQTHYFPLLEMEGKAIEINFEIQRKDKLKIPVLINTTKVVGSDGMARFHSVVFKIVQRSLYEKELLAERKRAEALSEKLKATNEKILQQANTIQAQNESLDRLNAVKDKFFRIVAHDIKAPLNSLYSFLDLIETELDDLDTEAFKKMSQKIGQSIHQAVKNADELLTWAQSQMKEYGVNATHFLVGELIGEVVDTIRSLALKKQISIKYELDENLKIAADRDQVIFILRNLLTNAIKFTQIGGRIKIHTVKIEDGMVQISVEDNGVGMNQQLLDSIFSFDQNTTTLGTEGEKGTGIGLVQTQEFVKMNNGTIDVISEENKGSTFLVRLKAGL